MWNTLTYLVRMFIKIVLKHLKLLPYLTPIAINFPLIVIIESPCHHIPLKHSHLIKHNHPHKLTHLITQSSSQFIPSPTSH